jgi:N-acetylneuraminic acid mutarotase
MFIMRSFILNDVLNVAPGCRTTHRSLYAIGGYDQNVNVHSSVERYDEQTNSWALIASMNIARARLAAVVFDGHIYAIGGYDGSTRLSSVERFDPTSGRWQLVAPMAKPRDYLSAAAIGQHLYAIGEIPRPYVFGWVGWCRG